MQTHLDRKNFRCIQLSRQSFMQCYNSTSMFETLKMELFYKALDIYLLKIRLSFLQIMCSDQD
jgi:hypothetical protein